MYRGTFALIASALTGAMPGQVVAPIGVGLRLHCHWAATCTCDLTALPRRRLQRQFFLFLPCTASDPGCVRHIGRLTLLMGWDTAAFSTATRMFFDTLNNHEHI